MTHTNRTLITGLLVIVFAAHAGAQSPIERVPMNGELPARGAISELFDQLDFQQATQSYLWALPLVAFAQWQAEHRDKFGADSGDLVLYASYEDKLGILTANATTPYIIGFIDLARTGPMVIESPAGPIAGGAGDMWQRSISDIGQTGPDKGKGGRYLLVPPGHKTPANAAGYYVIDMPMMNAFVGLRVLDPDPARGKELIEQLKIYPFDKSAKPSPTRLISPDGRKWSGTQPRGLAYWQRLHAILQEEPVAERDRFFMAMLANLGIEKGKPFAPSERQKKLLVEGARAGELMAQANSFAKRFPGSVWWPDRKWELVLNIDDPSQRVENYDQLLERTAWFYEAVTNSKGMISKMPGLGQAYLGAYTDAGGEWLDGGKDYRLHIAPNPPAKQFWSITLYDVGTRCFVDNAQRKADLSSRQGLMKNPDGSIDLFFGPSAPKEGESNWVQTVSGKHWFAYMRFYGPTEAYFDKSWKLGDIEEAR